MKKFLAIVTAVVILIAAGCFTVGCVPRNEKWYNPSKQPKRPFVTNLTVEEHIANITRLTEERFEYEIACRAIKSFTVDIVYSFDNEPEYFLVEFDCIGEVSNPVFLGEFEEVWKLCINRSFPHSTKLYEQYGSDHKIKLYSYDGEPEWRVSLDKDGVPNFKTVIPDDWSKWTYIDPAYMHLIGYIEDDEYMLGLPDYCSGNIGNGYNAISMMQWHQSIYKKYGYENAKKYYGGFFDGYDILSKFAAEQEEQIVCLGVFNGNWFEGPNDIPYNIYNQGAVIDESEFEDLVKRSIRFDPNIKPY